MMLTAFIPPDWQRLRSEAAVIDAQVGGGLKVDDPSPCRRAAYHLATFAELAARHYEGPPTQAVKDATIRRVRRYAAEMRDCAKLVGSNDDPGKFAELVEVELGR